MKNVMNISKKVFLMVALLATVMGYANDGSFFISKKDAKRTVLTLSDVKAGNLFTITDANDLVLYKETIQKTGIYIKGFNLSALPDGAYAFKINKDMELKSIPFTMKRGKVDFNRENTEIIFKPSTIVKGDMVYISKLSLNNAPLEIEIYRTDSKYESYKLIYDEILKPNASNKFERIFKIENKARSNYKIIYRNQGETFIEYI